MKSGNGDNVHDTSVCILLKQAAIEVLAVTNQQCFRQSRRLRIFDKSLENFYYFSAAFIKKQTKNTGRLGRQQQNVFPFDKDLMGNSLEHAEVAIVKLSRISGGGNGHCSRSQHQPLTRCECLHDGAVGIRPSEVE